MKSLPTATLLFIDDDAAYMAVAQHVLSSFPSASLQTIWRRSGASGLEELRTNRAIDLVVVDHYLQDVSGFDLLNVIREAGIPVILLTTQREFRLAIEALRYGVEDYLLKDDAVGDLLPRTVLNVLERVRLKRQIMEQERDDLIAQKKTDAVRELVVTVCHEFNNPLAAIKISTDILGRQVIQEEERRAVAEIDRNITRVEVEIQRLREINFE